MDKAIRNMNVTIHEVEQGSPEWTDLRLGKLTASKLKSILKLDGTLKAPSVRITALSKIIAEKETGFSTDSDFISDSMEWGLDHEEEVKEKYANDFYAPIGFATNSKFKHLGCSPDMVFYDNHGKFHSGIEIKCPNSDTHIRYCIEDKIPNDYWPQIWAYFLIFELESMTFVSYDPRNTKRPYFKKTVQRAEIAETLQVVEESIKTFEEQINTYL